MIGKLCKGNDRCLSILGKNGAKFNPQGDWNGSWIDKAHDEDERVVLGVAGNGAWDDISGLPLDARLVKKARELEMQFFHKMGVYDVVDLEHQKTTGGKIIDLKWIDIKKGGHGHAEH